MAHEVPDIALNNGVEMPLIGLGVFQTPPDETRSVRGSRTRPRVLSWDFTRPARTR